MMDQTLRERDGQLYIHVGQGKWRPATQYECYQCGRLFYSSREQHYCSRECVVKVTLKIKKSRQIGKRCPICSAYFKVAPSQDGKQTTCGQRSCGLENRRRKIRAYWDKYHETHPYSKHYKDRNHSREGQGVRFIIPSRDKETRYKNGQLQVKTGKFWSAAERRTCKYCGNQFAFKEYFAKRGVKGYFCSPRCRGEWDRAENLRNKPPQPCPVCGEDKRLYLKDYRSSHRATCGRPDCKVAWRRHTTLEMHKKLGHEVPDE